MSNTRLIAATALVMLAFAGNSLLNRAGLLAGDITPAGFTLIRLISGAVILGIIIKLQGKALRFEAMLKPSLYLFIYAACFSFAYISLDAGIGALILFGVVQITMFVGALLGGERPAPRRYLGMGLSFFGLILLTNPFGATANLYAASLMALAGLAWGLFSLEGRKREAPIVTMGTGFVMSLPLAFLLYFAKEGIALPSLGRGAFLAVISGAITSGLGYALWYSVLPKLQASLASVVQISVPVIAVILGAILLGERLDMREVIASMVIVVGLLVALLPKKKPA